MTVACRPLFQTGAASLRQNSVYFCVNGGEICSLPGRGMRIYLTFDDGIYPESKYLDSISRLDSVKITVLLVGKNVNADSLSKSIFKNYRDNPLIAVGNHSYTHANSKYRKFYRSTDSVVYDINRNQRELDIPGKLVRLPGRNAWNLNGMQKHDLADAVQAADSLSTLGYEVFGWDCEWQYDSVHNNFFTASQMEFLVKNCRNRFAPNEIVILCHDSMLTGIRFRTELRLFIKRMRSQGYGFETLDQYKVNMLR